MWMDRPVLTKAFVAQGKSSLSLLVHESLQQVIPSIQDVSLAVALLGAIPIIVSW